MDRKSLSDLEELRQICPIAHTNRFLGVYFPTRYEDVSAVAYDTEHFSSRRLFVREGRMPLIKTQPITSDPPEHRAQRMLLMPPFSPPAIKQLEPRIRAFCRNRVARLRDRKECDTAIEYAQEIPVHVTAFMLGLSEDDGDRFRQWIHDFFETGATDVTVVERVIEELRAFFASEIARRRTTSTDDLVSCLVNLRIDGQTLPDDHINGTLRLLLFAGIDTTWSAIGVSLWHLATHAQDRKRLVAEPELIPTAVEEFLRAYAPVTMAREVVKETSIGGCHFKRGEMVMLALPAANRDPAIFENASQVVLDRAENRHAAFGLGIHRCIGSHLARMEITVALQEWLQAIPEFALAEGGTVTWSSGTVRGPRTLPLILGRSGADVTCQKHRL